MQMNDELEMFSMKSTMKICSFRGMMGICTLTIMITDLLIQLFRRSDMKKFMDLMAQKDQKAQEVILVQKVKEDIRVNLVIVEEKEKLDLRDV